MAPHYLADYLRAGFGQEQVRRLYTGSTGLIELTAEHVDRIVVSTLGSVMEQVKLSSALRKAEVGYQSQLGTADTSLKDARKAFEDKSSS